MVGKSVGTKIRKHIVVDEDTGDEVPALVFYRKKWKGENFFMGFQDAIADIAKRRLGSEAKDVFLLILARMDYNNIVTIPQVEIARQLGMKKQNVSRAVSILVKEGVLRVDPYYSNKYKRRLMLNREVAWKGKLRQLGEQERNYKKSASNRSKKSGVEKTP